MKNSRLSLLAAVGTLALAGCGSAEGFSGSAVAASAPQGAFENTRGSAAASAVAASATQGVFENIRARNESVSRGPGLYDSPPSAMPQVRYSVDGRAPISLADAYVIGELVAVEAGRSFRWTQDGENEIRHEVPFGAENSQASTVHLTLRIQRSIVDPNQPQETRRNLAPGNDIRLGLALNAQVDINTVRDELKTADSLAALLYEPSPVFDYDRSLWAIGLDGALPGTITDGRTVTFPALEVSSQRSGENPDHTVSYTVEDLEKPSDQVIRVTRNPETGRYERPKPTADAS